MLCATQRKEKEICTPYLIDEGEGKALKEWDIYVRIVSMNLQSSLPSNNLESKEQELLFNWAKDCVRTNVHPELEVLYAIPNGGYRHTREATALKRQGVKAGVSDICLPLARGKYHGLYIELKVGKNKPSEAQLHWLQLMQNNGYGVAVCYGGFEAKRLIEKYLKLGEFKNDL